MSPAKQSTQTTGMQHWVCRIHCSIAVILALAFPDNHNVAAQDFPTPTLSYQTPAKLTVGDAPIDLKDHVTTRFFDWDQDSDLDLLAGGGDGRLWLFQNIGTTKLARFKSKQPILAGNRDRWGDSYTGVLLTNLVGNPIADLVVCHSSNQVTIHENIGKNGAPIFSERGITFEVQKNCQGRFDAADWDGDGTVDLITGSFDGKLQWHPNLGTTDSPKFGPGESFYSIQSAYNAHPRIIDFNQDGRLDLLLGNNWGSVTLYLNQSQDELSLRKSKPLLWS
ncbi:MAG: VCBS repeat-containing protein, partial [Mariniblastus sp.]|nr:VCBS repeat-containing protein [Mariniblastus sp.]